MKFYVFQCSLNSLYGEKFFNLFVTGVLLKAHTMNSLHGERFLNLFVAGVLLKAHTFLNKPAVDTRQKQSPGGVL